MWPRPRADRWRLGQQQPDEFPDLSDGLLFLEPLGIEVSIENSCPLLLNPLVRHHEFYSGLDPVRAVRLALHVGRYDALLCIGDATAYVFLHLKRLLGLRAPVVLIDPALSDGYPRRKRLQDSVLPLVDRVVVYGRVQLDYLRREYGDRVRAEFLYHRADTTFYTPGLPGAAVEPFVFTIGNDVSRDYVTFVGAAREALRLGVGARFVAHTTLPIDGEGVVDVRRGYVSYASLRELYRQAAVVVVPLSSSRHAGGINALLEAMAMGKPIVVSESDGIRDYLEGGAVAKLVPTGDAQAMARAVAELLADPGEGARLGAAARRFVEAQCANGRYASQLGRIIQDVVHPAWPDAGTGRV